MIHRVVDVVLAAAALLSGCAASSSSQNDPDSLELAGNAGSYIWARAQP